MGSLARRRVLNDFLKYQQNPWGSQKPMLDDKAVLLKKLGRHCDTCKRVILNEHIELKGEACYCPDCVPKK